MSKRAQLLIVTTLLLKIAVTAQPHYFRHYQVEQGLSNNTVTSCFQDSDGFMWFGTKDGLNRYDGYTFKVFTNDPDDSLSLGSNFVKCVYEDPNKHLWIGTDKGLYRYDKNLDVFHLLPISGDEPGEIRSIRMDQDKNLWFINNLDLYRVSTDGILTSYPEITASSVDISRDGKVWIAGRMNSLYRFNKMTGTFDSYPIDTEEPFVIEKLKVISETHLLIGTTSQGIVPCNITVGNAVTVTTRLPDKYKNTFVRDILTIDEDEIWIATEDGIFISDPALKQIVHVTKEFNDPYSLSDNAVYSLFKDNENGIWAGTYFGGLNYLAHPTILFEKMFTKPGSNSIVGNAIREICKDRSGNLWIGTEDAGLNVWEVKTGAFRHFTPQPQQGSLGYHNIHALLATDSELWIGTFKHGLEVMDLTTRKIVRRYFNKTDLDSEEQDFIYCLMATRNGLIYAGTGAGLYVLDRNKQKKFSRVDWLPIQDLITSLYEDEEGKIWVGTIRDGFYRYSFKDHLLKNFSPTKTSPYYFPAERVNGIFEDSRKMIWFSTNDGLIEFNPATLSISAVYDEHSGLPSDLVFKTLEDNEGKIWVSTSRGLANLNPFSKDIDIYTTANGLLSDQFNYNSAFKDDNGRLFFGTVRGLISFEPDKESNEALTPPVHITGIQINNKDVPIGRDKSPLKRSIIHTDQITLDYTQSTFSLDFAALTYKAPEMTQYFYRMDGLSKEWVHLTHNRKVYFTNLAAGQYTFMVKAMPHQATGSNPAVASLRIHITPPFWASTWAYTLYGTFAIIATLLIVRNYHLSVEQKNERRLALFQNEKERELYSAKIEFFTNIAHEIKTPLTLIKLPLEKVINYEGLDSDVKENLRIMEKNTNRLINLSSQLLDFRKAERNILSLSFVKTDICDVMIELLNQFKPAAEEKKIIVQSELPSMHFQAYVDPEAFRKIISNLLSNAIKYGSQLVTVSILPFTSNDTSFSVRVANDGQLIPGELTEKIFDPLFRVEGSGAEGTGIGLALALSLAKLHDGKLYLEKGQALNSFILTLPIHQEKEFQLYDELFKQVDAPGTDQEELLIVDSARNTILLVEDNHEILEFIAKELSREYNIVKTANGVEGLEKLASHSVQLIISDVMMPVMDGFAFCRTVKSNFEYSHIPLILLTAKNTLQAKIDGLDMGADAYIEKPFSQQHLNAQINSLLTNRNNIKEHFSVSPLASIKTVAHSKSDENFVGTIAEFIDQHLGNSNLSVELMADTLNMSRQTLYRKIKGLTNLTPHELITLTKLKKAAELLGTGSYKIYEVADMIGYTVAGNFSRDFMKQFGISPTEYAGTASGKNGMINSSSHKS